MISPEIQKQRREYSLTLLILVCGVAIINLLIAWYIRGSNIPFVANTQPIGFTFDYFSSTAILILVTWAIHEFDIHIRAGISIILLLSGLYSNFVEKFIWGSVADYMSIYELAINLADVQIILGLIFLNWKLWTDPDGRKQLLAEEGTTPQQINEAKRE
jgi:hypothetical protein